MTRLLVPTDFSENAENALELAGQIASRMNAEIELLHVLDIPEGDKFSGTENISFTGEIEGETGMDEVYFVKLMEKTRERINGIQQRPEFKGIKIFDKIKTGTPYRRIYEETLDGKIDLVIMGTSGTSNWEEELVGSNAERVVRRSHCPVLTVRTKIDLKVIRNIAYASRFIHNHPELINILKQLQDMLKAKLHLVKITTPGNFKNDKDNYATLKSFAEENKFDNYETHVYNFEHEEDGIISFAEEFKMNMIVMATEGRTGFARLLEGSIAEDVVNYAKIPVLTYLIKQNN